jgi:hypothetical protein
MSATITPTAQAEAKKVPQVYVDLTTIGEQLDEVERRMRATVFGAEKRLGLENVLKSFRLMATAQEALRELSVTVHPMPPMKEPSVEELMAGGYM